MFQAGRAMTPELNAMCLYLENLRWRFDRPFARCRCTCRYRVLMGRPRTTQRSLNVRGEGKTSLDTRLLLAILHVTRLSDRSIMSGPCCTTS